MSVAYRRICAAPHILHRVALRTLLDHSKISVSLMVLVASNVPACSRPVEQSAEARRHHGPTGREFTVEVSTDAALGEDKWWLTPFEPGGGYVHLPGEDGETLEQSIEERPAFQYSSEKLLTGQCGNFDGAKVDRDGSIFMWGWACDPRDAEPAIGVLLLAQGEQLPVEIQVGVERLDVAAVTSDERLRDSGWRGRIGPALVTAESRHLRAVAVLEDGYFSLIGEMEVEVPAVGGAGSRGASKVPL